MTDITVKKRLPCQFTAHAELSRVGQYLKRNARIDHVIDLRCPVTGESDFDAIESLRQEFFFPATLLPFDVR